MEQSLVQPAKPPWKLLQWQQSPAWSATNVASILFTKWQSAPDDAMLTVKQQIGDLDRQHKWELAKKMVNPYELVYTHDDARLPQSVSMEQPLSRSYFKMIELLEVTQFFQTAMKGARNMVSAHVAEGPGGFIQALLQTAERFQKRVTAAHAITLRPTNPHTPGWKKAAAFLARNREVRIHYGADGTGDIYKRENQDSFVAQCGAGQVSVFTADGGFDFSTDYSKQERDVFQLLVASVRIGLLVLKPGGLFILKLFDCASPHTQFLTVLLGRCFREWTLYKPAMTRPCNSERYFLGKGFRGRPPEWILAVLEQKLATEDQFPVMDAGHFTEAETVYLQEHIRATTAHQLRAIEEAIQLSTSPETWFQKWYLQHLRLCHIWCETFRVPSVPKAQNIMKTCAKFGLQGISIYS